MSIFRKTVIVLFVASVGFMIVPDLVHPYSFQLGLLDAVMLVALVGPAVGYFFGVPWCRFLLAIVTSVAASIVAYLPFIPVEYDRDNSDVYSWAYALLLLIVTACVAWIPSKPSSTEGRNHSPEPTPGAGH